MAEPMEIDAAAGTTPEGSPAPVPASPAPRGRPLVRRAAAAIGSAVEWVFGLLTLIVALAVFSVIPGLNLLSLGYLLDASGRVAKSGRLRDGVFGVRKAAAFGGAALGIWLALWPVRFAAGMWRDAELISTGSRTAAGWKAAFILAALLTAWHILWACARGAGLRHFLWPAPKAFWDWVRAKKPLPYHSGLLARLSGLRLGRYFKLGGLGFLGTLAWLAVPVGLLSAGAFLPPAAAALLGLVGGTLLFLVAIHLPFLQARYAMLGRFGALFEVREVRRLFNRAPVAWWFSLLATLVFAIPLYLLKIEFPPKEIAWLPSLIFVVFIFPARLLGGWAMARAMAREEPRHAVFRWLARLGIFPVAAFYVVAVYLTQYLSWNGALSLIEQHAFLVPAPMLSL